MITLKASSPVRRGFTLTEVTFSLALLVVTALLAAQLATWAIVERIQTDAYLETTETATNLLENAAAQPWNELTPEWAGLQKLPEPLSARWPDCRLAVRVEPVEKQAGLKHVTVEIKWSDPKHLGWRPIVLNGWFASRAGEGKK